MKTNIKHLLELDILRVLLILLVVAGHCVSTCVSFDCGNIALKDPSFAASAFWQYQVMVADWMHKFDMNLFMGLSGACYYMTESKYASFWVLYLRKFHRVMIPCFAVGLFYMLPVKYLAGFYGPNTIGFALGSFLSGSNALGHLWFLPALMWIFMLFWLSRRLCHEHWLLLVLLPAIPYAMGMDKLVQCLGFQAYYLSCALYFWLWFTLGYLFMRKDAGRFFVAHPGRWAIVCFFISCGKGYIPLIFLSIAGCLMVYTLAVWMSQRDWQQYGIFRVLLKYNFSIYLFHDPLNYAAFTIANILEVISWPGGKYIFTFGLRFLWPLLGALLIGIVYAYLRRRFENCVHRGIPTILDAFCSRYAGILGIVMVGFALRWYLYVHSSFYTGAVGVDEHWYYIPSMEYILQHGIFAFFGNELSVMFPCGAPLYMALAARVLGDDLSRLRLLGLFVGCLNLVLCYHFVRQLFNQRVGFLTAFLLAINIPIAEYSYQLITENWFMFLLLTAGCCWLQGRHRPFSYGRLLLVSLLLIWAALTRSIITLLPFAFVVFYGVSSWYGRDREAARKRLHRWLAVSVIFYIVLGAAVVKNEVLFQRPVVTSGAGTSLWLGSRLASHGDEPPYYGQAYDSVIQPEIYAITGGKLQLYLDADVRLQQAAWENIRLHTWEYLKMDICKLARLTIGTNFSWFYSYGCSLMEYRAAVDDVRLTLWQAAMILLYTGTYAFGIQGMWLYRRSQAHRGLMAMAGYFLLLSLPFLATLRYGLPVFLLVLPFAAAAVLHLWAKKQYRQLAAGIACMVGMSGYIFLGL